MLGTICCNLSTKDFLEQLSEGVDEVDFRSPLAHLSSQLDLVAFAYLSLPPQGNKPTLISNYPTSWTARYLEHQYQSIDTVIVRPRRRMPLPMGLFATGC
ncbi:autoinducer binding domain-containing protein [Mesorhizobium sp. WSM1293]|uniref:autoinducer binding domain-containing protein n=1 Tax=Mesorhizobium sp. WSM1293 TaxID=1040984 RepID=UPI000480EF68|nr:autoinducer binding domain-containing protein [Mesorhizobium sp. WSM1293]